MEELLCGGDCGVIRDEMASTPISSSFSHLALSATCFLCCWVARECTLNIRGDAHKHVHQWWCRLSVSSGIGLKPTWICDKMQNFALHREYLDILQDFEANCYRPQYVPFCGLGSPIFRNTIPNCSFWHYFSGKKTRSVVWIQLRHNLHKLRPNFRLS